MRQYQHLPAFLLDLTPLSLLTPSSLPPSIPPALFFIFPFHDFNNILVKNKVSARLKLTAKPCQNYTLVFPQVQQWAPRRTGWLDYPSVPPLSCLFILAGHAIKYYENNMGLCCTVMHLWLITMWRTDNYNIPIIMACKSWLLRSSSQHGVVRGMLCYIMM